MKISFQPSFCHTSFRGSKINETFDDFYSRYQKGYTAPFHKDLRACLDVYLEENKDIKKSDIKGFAGHGGLSTVFDLGEKGVLKCSQENFLEYRRHNPEFDIPFSSPVVKINNFYFVRQPKADISSVTQEDCVDVIKRMSKEGFEPSFDFDKSKTRQVGIYNGRAYLLDTRCALPKPDKFSLDVYDFCARNKRVFYSCKKSDIEDFVHVSEIPRANLTVREAKRMILTIMKDNVKAGFPPLNDGLSGLLRLTIRCIKQLFV
ncbi:MAG: hypothetical protein NC191_05380 [Muribaculaceae bacterium]|nr:hypothetical protein [Muribaculaceae bacterium]